MKTVKEVSRITGVSVRTLHHYDAISLLKPTRVTEAGYRLYDDAALQRLQSILLFRTLRFSLKEIGEILDSPSFDPMAALEQQLAMLELQKQQLEETIAHVRKMKETGVISMDFSTFNTEKLDRYAEEAKAMWGSTEAWMFVASCSSFSIRSRLASSRCLASSAFICLRTYWCTSRAINIAAASPTRT